MNVTLTEDERLFADVWVHSVGDWICTPEWMAHRGLALPADWLAATPPPPGRVSDARLDTYVAAALAAPSDPVRFNPPHRLKDGWRYKSVKGQGRVSLNADLAELFEGLTPDSRWRLFLAPMRYRDGVCEGRAFARVHHALGVRCVVASRDRTCA